MARPMDKTDASRVINAIETQRKSLVSARNMLAARGSGPDTNTEHVASAIMALNSAITALAVADSELRSAFFPV